eukprot:8423578-Alexandrium_andersonii.AAC.1
MGGARPLVCTRALSLDFSEAVACESEAGEAIAVACNAPKARGPVILKARVPRSSFKPWEGSHVLIA